LLAGCCVVAGLLLGWVLIGATLRMGAYGVIAPAALLYAAPLPVGGVLLGWALACGHRQYALYIAAWFMAVATVGLSSYLLPMSTSMYQVAQLAGVPRFSLEYAGAVTIVRAAIQTQVLISGIYCLVTLALLVLPLPLSAAALRGRLWRVAAARRTTSEQTYEANRQVTPLDDRRLLPARPSHWSSPTVRSQEAPGATPTALHTHSDCQMRQVPAPSTSAGWTPPLWVAKHRRACWSRRRHILRRSGRLPHSS
jgi:hypothetical protein